MRSLPVLLLLVLLAACGGGSGDDEAPAPTPGTPGTPGGGGGGGGTGGPTPNPGPQIALLMVNGHSFGTVANYLATSAGPFLETALRAAGYTVQTSYFTDDLDNTAPGGYLQLVAKLQQVQDDWVSDRTGPTRIVLVGHSHGGVRAHAALRAKPLVPVRLLVDLDASSNGWGLTHGGDAAAMGGGPVDAYTIANAGTCAALPLGPDESGPLYDLEDVVPLHVQEAYEVRTGDVVPNPLQFEYYDERWNARPDGTRTGLSCDYSATPHAEPALATGTTLPRVRDWILARLAGDP